MCRGEYINIPVIQELNLATIAICSTSTKDKIKLQIIIFCVKHNREQTITLEFEISWGRGKGLWDVA